MGFSFLIVPQNSLNVANPVYIKRVYMSSLWNVLQEFFVLFPNILYINLTSRLMSSLRAKCIVAATETAATQRECPVDFIVTT